MKPLISSGQGIPCTVTENVAHPSVIRDRRGDPMRPPLVQSTTQRREDVFRNINPLQGTAPFICTAQSKTRSLPPFLLGVGRIVGSLHNNAEEVVTLHGDFVLRERSNKFHGL